MQEAEKQGRVSGHGSFCLRLNPDCRRFVPGTARWALFLFGNGLGEEGMPEDQRKPATLAPEGHGVLPPRGFLQDLGDDEAVQPLYERQKPFLPRRVRCGAPAPEGAG